MSCFICGSPEHFPREHRNDLLPDGHALRLAREMFGDTTESPRGRILARFVMAKLTGEDPGDAYPFDR